MTLAQWKRNVNSKIFQILLHFAELKDSVCGSVSPSELRLTFQLKCSGNAFFFLHSD